MCYCLSHFLLSRKVHWPAYSYCYLPIYKEMMSFTTIYIILTFHIHLYYTMASPHTLLMNILLLVSQVTVVLTDSHNYIIHMDLSLMPNIYTVHHNWYMATVDSAVDLSQLHDTSSSSSSSSSKLLYSYTHAIHGFSAHLSHTELEVIKNSPGYVSSVKDKTVKPDTTHSSKFLGLNSYSGLWPASQYGEDVIIGLVDTGIWPESRSFSDVGMKDIPSRWKGECKVGTQFNASLCNKKLIGAQYFNKGLTAQNPNLTIAMNSTRDTEGHGTHTSSTAAGAHVEDTSYFGYASGTVRGMAPRAHVAMYKALWDEGAYISDIVAAIDQAIMDGVDVISISLGFDVTSLSQDPIAIATFAAIEKGIFVSTSAGNEGPLLGTLHNGTPWVITVAAGEMDRDYGGVITLGNGVRLTGRTLFPGNPLVRKTGFIFMDKCASLTELKRLDKNNVVVCEDINGLLEDQYQNIKTANVTAGIFITSNPDIEQFMTSPFPAIYVDPENGKIVKDYIRSNSSKPNAKLGFRKTIIGKKMAPKVASYSSRGPSPSCRPILKPDILAPGVLILAAWVPNSPVASVNSQSLYSDYNLISGTSMSCPHVAGVAALLKSAHPDWSPAAIRSAIMTTSYLVDNRNNPIGDLQNLKELATPFAMGSGHIDPNKALDPGLVYDASTTDYVNLLCALHYTTKEIKTITRSSSTKLCSNPSLDLNYPSFLAFFNSPFTSYSNRSERVREFRRTLTNVGEGPSTYTASLTPMKEFNVSVVPETLLFREKNEKLSFVLRIEGPSVMKNHATIWCHLSWSDDVGKHVVRSPIVATAFDSSES